MALLGVLSYLMTRFARTRSRSVTISGSFTTWWHLPTRISGGTVSRGKVLASTCSDFHGRPIADSTFTSVQATGWPVLNGSAVSYYKYATEKWEVVFNNTCVSIGTPPNETPLVAPDGWFLSTVAGTNPSRPVVTIPTLVQDFIDIPKQIRDLGKLLASPRSQANAKGVANQFLSWKFGWLPLFDDLHQLLDLQASIIKRNKELHALYSGKGLKRRLKFDDTTGNSEGVEVYYFKNDGVTTSQMNVLVDNVCKKRSWATITWYPTTPPPYHPDDAKWNDLSRRLVLGFTPEGMAKGLWDVIPWTWLLGWFTNVGKYTLAYSNTVPASHSKACFMSEVVSTSKIKSIVPIGTTEFSVVGSGSRTYSSKTRIVSGALTPGFNMPYLDMSRLSVLSALAIQRIKR